MMSGMRRCGVHKSTRPLLEHFEADLRPVVAQWFVNVITTYGPPVCNKPSQMVSRVVRNAPPEISEVVKAHKTEALEAAGFWLLWWESLAPSGSRGRV